MFLILTDALIKRLAAVGVRKSRSYYEACSDLRNLRQNILHFRMVFQDVVRLWNHHTCE